MYTCVGSERVGEKEGDGNVVGELWWSVDHASVRSRES